MTSDDPNEFDPPRSTARPDEGARIVVRPSIAARSPGLRRVLDRMARADRAAAFAAADTRLRKGR